MLQLYNTLAKNNCDIEDSFLLGFSIREVVYADYFCAFCSQGTTLALSPAISAYDPDTFNASLRYSIMVDSLSGKTRDIKGNNKKR